MGQAAPEAQGWEEHLANRLELSFIDQTHVEDRQREEKAHICGRAAIRPANLEAVGEGLSHGHVHSKANCMSSFAAACCNCLWEGEAQPVFPGLSSGPAAICWVSFSVALLVILPARLGMSHCRVHRRP